MILRVFCGTSCRNPSSVESISSSTSGIICLRMQSSFTHRYHNSPLGEGGKMQSSSINRYNYSPLQEGGINIQLTNAGKRFNQDWIFRHMNYNFEQGRYYAIIGPNGS